ncbi:MAG: hypothetical protein KDD15_17685, partial [Lewinella sp.]|nr:hypothetical protein [Lewinella sp.]
VRGAELRQTKHYFLSKSLVGLFTQPLSKAGKENKVVRKKSNLIVARINRMLYFCDPLWEMAR